jgi:hypothetical protein
MEVIIQEVVSTVRTTDGAALLEPRTMAQIVRTVLAALEAAKTQAANREADTHTGTPTSGRSE